MELEGVFPGAEEALARVKEQLRGTPYEAITLRPLSGGNANFIFHGVLATPLQDGTNEVVIKHGEGFVASSPDFPIPLARCKIEVGLLKALADLQSYRSGPWSVRTPKFFHFDAEANNQVQEYQPGAASLKDYAVKHYGGTAAADATALKQQCIELGRALGGWLQSFHAWVNHQDQSHLRELAAQNKQLQQIKQFINYGNLVSVIDKFPAVLGECKGLFEEIGAKTALEIADDAPLSIIHGDFWTGNILLADQPPAEEPKQRDVFVVDWEMVELGLFPVDIGQMVAELYELKFFKDIEAGLWIIQGLCSGYGPTDDDFAYRALVHTGAHLIGFGTSVAGWGTPKQREGMAREGRDILTAAWKRERDFFADHPLKWLFSEKR